MKKILNNTHLEGYLFSHTLEKRVTGEGSKTPGTDYIRGTIEVVTDDAGLNVVPVVYSYVTAKTKAGKDNLTYKTLAQLIDLTGNTFVDVGTAATKLRLDTAMGLNDFYNAEGELITYKINDAGFAHIVNAFGADRNSFEADVLITSVIDKPADEEKEGSVDMVVIKGATFNFRGTILPIELVVKSEGGMKYFLDLAPSSDEPVFAKVWGNVVCTTVDTSTVEQGAFGAPKVNTSTRKLREWVVTGIATEAYEYGEDSGLLTPAEVAQAIADREVDLVDVKKRHDEWQASKGTSTPPAGGAAPAAGAPAAAGKFSF